MNFLRLHWFDIGAGLAVLLGAVLIITRPTGLALLLWISLISLFLHQFEEYRYPGYFPGMMNKVMFSSQQPDRFPLNPQTALMINLSTGWLVYFLAACFAQKAIWLGIASLLISAGNFIAHTFIFNIKGKTSYNPGMFTAIVLFLPVVAYFFWLVVQGHLAGPIDWVLGIALGIALNVIGILKLIDWLKDNSTRYIFPKRNLLPAARKGPLA